jgi:hypothetical protein
MVTIEFSRGLLSRLRIRWRWHSGRRRTGGSGFDNMVGSCSYSTGLWLCNLLYETLHRRSRQSFVEGANEVVEALILDGVHLARRRRGRCVELLPSPSCDLVRFPQETFEEVRAEGGDPLPVIRIEVAQAQV